MQAEHRPFPHPDEFELVMNRRLVDSQDMGGGVDGADGALGEILGVSHGGQPMLMPRGHFLPEWEVAPW